MRLTERVIDENGIEHIFTKYVKDNQKLKDEKLCQLEDIEDELGLPLNIWIYLVQEFLIKEKRVYIENSIDNEKERKEIKEVNNGIDKRFILDIDFEKKEIIVQGEAFSPFDGMPFKDYGKTWALTKKELEHGE